MNDGKYLLCLLHSFAKSEEERKATPNHFHELWMWNAFIRYRTDKYESMCVALMDEMSGNIELAADLFNQIAADNPADTDVKQILQDFNQRNNLAGS